MFDIFARFVICVWLNLSLIYYAKTGGEGVKFIADFPIFSSNKGVSFGLCLESWGQKISYFPCAWLWGMKHQENKIHLQNRGAMLCQGKVKTYDLRPKT